MKIMTVVGARPNFMKAAPILAAIKEYNREAARRLNGGGSSSSVQATPGLVQSILVHTGQHYDQYMSDAFFADLCLPKADVHLGVGSGSHAAQTAEIMRSFEAVLLHERPDVVVLVGDVNSTVACALVAAKASYDGSGTRPLIAHVEAGLRSFDRTMPEEINRIVTDQLSDLLFVTETSGLHNLAREGVPAEKVHFVGNTMIDSLLAHKDKAEQSPILSTLGLRHDTLKLMPYALLTLHRSANVDTYSALLNILEGLHELARAYPVIFPAHPRTVKRVRELGLQRYFLQNASERLTSIDHGSRRGIRMTDPLGYLDFLCLMKNATIVVTDSGGIQEETTCLGVRCVTVRENTERPVTVATGTNRLAGVSTEGIRQAIRKHLASPQKGATPEKWDGKSALRIVHAVTQAYLSMHKQPIESQPSYSAPLASFAPPPGRHGSRIPALQPIRA